MYYVDFNPGVVYEVTKGNDFFDKGWHIWVSRKYGNLWCDESLIVIEKYNVFSYTKGIECKVAGGWFSEDIREGESLAWESEEKTPSTAQQNISTTQQIGVVVPINTQTFKESESVALQREMRKMLAILLEEDVE
jgi:hypothetical protein